jgi:hypothetical protein
MFAHLNHSHLSQSDKLGSLRSGTPSLLRCKGFCTCDQATTHFLPCTDSVPDQRNARMILMKALCTHPGSSTLSAVCTGIPASMVLIKVSLPLLCIIAPFHIGSLSSLAGFKPNRIICKRTDVNYSSFHLRVFIGLSNAQEQRQTSTISIPRDNFGEIKAKFNLETSRINQMQLYKCIHVPYILGLS